MSRPAGIRTILTASLVGTTVEWYDFFLYSTAAALVFPGLFFPSQNPLVSTLLSFGTFTVGFVARPVGGVLFGHIGDRLGRKRTLVITMVAMGVSTALIGLLPSYQQIGLAAPALLLVLRILQGLAVGGEWGGAVLLAVENAPPGRHGRYGSVPQIGLGLGLALGTGVFTLLGQTLGSDAFRSVGWRAAFVLSLLLVVVGLVVRLRVLETPAFRDLAERGDTSAVPIRELFQLPRHRRNVLLGLLTRWGEGASFNTWGVFVITYATASVHLPRTDVLVAVTVSALVMAAMAPVAGQLADRFSRRLVFGVGVASFGLTVVPSFAVLQTGQSWVLFAVVGVQLGIWYGLMTGAESTLFAELFDTKVRYTGMSLVFQGSGIYASGLTPVILTALLAVGGGTPWLAAGYLALTAVISLVAVRAIRPTETTLAALETRDEQPLAGATR
ncbi:MFS transporter [Fodinicola feengrottensis]|uniref:MFS transporter n=2 Tax=Fodinicola feengrottensis TaxID=435914 RepID=A0ABN2FPY1_9ACTN